MMGRLGNVSGDAFPDPAFRRMEMDERTGMDKLRIGNVTLDNRVILAPMAGVSDLPFRLLCREQGAGLVCSEMVSAKAIYYKNKNTEGLLEIHDQEGPVPCSFSAASRS